ncbi:MAG: hypothetical protein ACO3D0_07565 [Ilumatobacteraceae bacterium]
MTDSSAPGSDRRRLGEPAALAAVVGFAAAVMFASHRAGHWWGDDWALYLRQAEALLDGSPGRVLRENDFTVSNSLGAGFSPTLYPWGFPLLLAPFVAALGNDLDRLAVVPVLAASAFSVAWYLLARRHVAVVPALLGSSAVVLSPLVLGWTELIQSELPFMAVVAWSLVLLDRLVDSERLVGPTVRILPLVGLGTCAAAAFAVRREGLALLAAIAIAQLGAIGAAWRRGRRPGLADVILLTLPHQVFVVTTWLLQIVLPTTVIPSTTGASLLNVWRFRERHAEHLLELVGLKRPWEDDPTVFGVSTIGWVVGIAFFVFAAAGGVLAVGRRRDAHLAAYAVVALAIGGSSRVLLNRYVCTVGPVVLVLVMIGVVATVSVVDPDRSIRRLRGVRLDTAILTLAMAALVAGNLANAHLRVDQAGELARTGAIEWGPTHPDATAMFDEVAARSDADSVIGAPKARAMTFATGRSAVQIDDYRPVPDIDLDLIVTEIGSSIDVTLGSDPALELVWSNARFRIHRPNR